MKLAGPALALAALTVATAAAASEEAKPVGETGKPTSAPVILHQDVPLYTVYAWERWGNFINAAAGSGTEIPYDAARVQVKVYTYPTGEIRAIRFANGTRTHRHYNLTDTVLYSWQTHRVHFVNDLATVVGPGDFAFHQKGVYHSGEELRRGGGIDLEFAVNVPGIHNDPTGWWSLAKDHPVQPAASWAKGSGYVEAIGDAAATAPAGAAHYRVRIADLPFAAREMYLQKGTSVTIRDLDKDRLMFVLSGQLKVTPADGKTYTLASEDTARAERGKPFTVEAIEDAEYVQTSVPPVAAAE